MRIENDNRSPITQLEIAAHWLQEAALQFSATKQDDFAQNCKRVSEQCRSVVRKNKEAA